MTVSAMRLLMMALIVIMLFITMLMLIVLMFVLVNMSIALCMLMRMPVSILSRPSRCCLGVALRSSVALLADLLTALREADRPALPL